MNDREFQVFCAALTGCATHEGSDTILDIQNSFDAVDEYKKQLAEREEGNKTYEYTPQTKIVDTDASESVLQSLMYLCTHEKNGEKRVLPINLYGVDLNLISDIKLGELKSAQIFDKVVLIELKDILSRAGLTFLGE